MKFEFINKISVKGKDKIGIAGKVILICSIVLLVMSFIQFILGGLDDVNLMAVFLPIIALVYFRLNYNSDGYISVKCDFIVKNDKFIINNYEVDTKDKHGVHNECIVIPYDSIKEISCVKEQAILKIKSQPVVTIVTSNGKEEVDFKSTGGIYTYTLYLPSEKIDEILNCINTNCSINISNSNNL